MKRNLMETNWLLGSRSRKTLGSLGVVSPISCEIGYKRMRDSVAEGGNT